MKFYSVHTIILSALFLLTAGTHQSSAAYVLVAGRGTNNVVRFDVTTEAASVYANYAAASSSPRDLAMDAAGHVYSSTSSANQNIVEFVPSGGAGPLTSTAFTPGIGGFGPGQIQFHSGELYAAGDAARQIIQYNGDTGIEIRRFGVTNDFNIRGMTIHNNLLYYAEIFQERIRRMDLNQSPPTGGTFITDTTNLNEPMDMVVGGNGNLYITNRASTLVQEYNLSTGAFVKTFANLQTLLPGTTAGDTGIDYNPGLDNYFLSRGNNIFRLSPAGALLQTYNSPLLTNAYGLIVVPVPEPATIATCLPILLGLLIMRRNRRQ